MGSSAAFPAEAAAPGPALAAMSLLGLKERSYLLSLIARVFLSRRGFREPAALSRGERGCAATESATRALIEVDEHNKRIIVVKESGICILTEGARFYSTTKDTDEKQEEMEKRNMHFG